MNERLKKFLKFLIILIILACVLCYSHILIIFHKALVWYYILNLSLVLFALCAMRKSRSPELKRFLKIFITIIVFTSVLYSTYVLVILHAIFTQPLYWVFYIALILVSLYVTKKSRQGRLKRFLKIFVTTIILSPILCFLYVFTIMWIVRYEEIRDYQEGIRNPNIEWEIMKKKIDAQIDAQWAPIDAGTKHEEAGQYELAIEEYKKAIDLGNDSVGHGRLAALYEKIGQYELAIQELNWIISHSSLGHKLIDEDIAKKRELEKLLEKSKESDIKDTIPISAPE